jgi:hypothetical protein
VVLDLAHVFHLLRDEGHPLQGPGVVAKALVATGADQLEGLLGGQITPSGPDQTRRRRIRSGGGRSSPYCPTVSATEMSRSELILP